MGSHGGVQAAERRGGEVAEKREVPINVLQGAGWRVEEEFIGAIRGTEKVTRSDFYTGVQYMEFTGWLLLPDLPLAWLLSQP